MRRRTGRRFPPWRAATTTPSEQPLPPPSARDGNREERPRPRPAWDLRPPGGAGGTVSRTACPLPRATALLPPYLPPRSRANPESNRGAHAKPPPRPREARGSGATARSPRPPDPPPSFRNPENGGPP